MHTPFFPSLRARMAACKTRSPDGLLPNDSSRLQSLLQPFFPAYFLSQTEEKENSRERLWTMRLTFWTFLWQVLHPGHSCRQAVHTVCSYADNFLQLPSLSSFCQARARLPKEHLLRIDQHIVQATRQRCPSSSQWHGWNLKVVDGSSSSMPDTPKCQQKWPQPEGQKKGCGFPVVKWVGLFCLATGALLAKGIGTLHCHDLRLLQQLWEFLRAGDLVLADRGFSSYPIYALFQSKGLAALFRLQTGSKSRKAPKRSRRKKVRKLGPGDHLILWQKPYERPAWISAAQWSQIPASLTLRTICFRAQTRGYRSQRFTLATTLLDPEKYPAQELIDLYARRWEVEGLIRQMKTVMKLEILRCQSPRLIEKEMIMHRIAYNLIHCLILESALCQQYPTIEISYAGTLSALQAFSSGKHCSKRSKTRLYQQLLEMIAAERLPKRPGRKEPRAIKRRPKPYSLLTKPRHIYKEIPHRARDYKYRARLKIRGLS